MWNPLGDQKRSNKPFSTFRPKLPLEGSRAAPKEYKATPENYEPVPSILLSFPYSSVRWNCSTFQNFDVSELNVFLLREG